MKKYLYFMFVALFATITLSLYSCKDNKEEPNGGDIVGTWKEKSLGDVGLQTYNQFRSDGTCVTVGVLDDEIWSDSHNKVNIEYGKWTKNGNTIKIVTEDGTTNYSIVKLTSNELGLSALGFTSYFDKVPDSEIEKYLK